MLQLSINPGAVPARSGHVRPVRDWYDDVGRIAVQAGADEAGWWIQCQAVGVFRVRRGVRHVEAWVAPGVSPALLTETFERTVQPLALQALGWQVLHASAVARPSGPVVAFCGRGHSGKSTLASAVAAHGWIHLADDALVLGGSTLLAVHPVPFVASLRPASRAYFDRIDAPLPAPSVPADRGVDRPLGLVFHLSPDAGAGSPPRLTRLPHAAAFRAVLAHAHAFDEADSRELRRTVETCLAIAERVPVFDLVHAPDLERLPQLTGLIVTTAETIVASGAPLLEAAR